MKSVDVLSGACTVDKKEYKYIYFRAINQDGFVGDWAPYTNAYLTNQLDLLVKTDSDKCTSCGTCCLPSSGGSCYYCDKTRYLSFGGNNFAILERDAKGGILAAYDGVGANRVTPTSLLEQDGKFKLVMDYSQRIILIHHQCYKE